MVWKLLLGISSPVSLACEPYFGNFRLACLARRLSLRIVRAVKFAWGLSPGTFAWNESLESVHLGTFTSKPSPGNFHLATFTLDRSFRTLTWELPLDSFCLGSFFGNFVWNLPSSGREFPPGNFRRDLSSRTLAFIRLGTCTWARSLEQFNSGSFAWELQLEILRVETGLGYSD